MESKKITAALAVVLAVACVIVAAVLISSNRKLNYLPDTSLEDMTEVLENAGITIDKSIIGTKRENGDVYVFGTDGYYETVANSLIGDEIANTYATPDGQIFEFADGALIEFGSGFCFRYSRDGKKHPLPDGGYMPEIISPTLSEYRKITETAEKFLDSGSRSFAQSASISIVTTVDMLYGDGERYYIVCSRTLDGVAITDNTVTCIYEDGVITAAEGTWCFLTEGESYSAQLTDHLNILFNAKKDITVPEGEKVGIVSIDRCYSLYYYGEGDEFCLIPCWQVTTDSAEKFIYNALDGTLYTIN